MPPHGRTFHSRRDDGRFTSTAGAVHHLLKYTPPRLALDPHADAESLRQWQRHVRGKLREMVLFPQEYEPPPPRQLRAEPRDGYELQRWEAYPEPGSVTPFLLLVPDGATADRPVPLVLCFPGTDHPKELLAGEPMAHGEPSNAAKVYPEHNRMGWWCATNGMAALCVDNPGTCEQACPGLGRTELVYHLISLGQSYLGLSTQRAVQLLRWAQGLPSVDATRIAAAGHSLGTGAALMLTALDPSLRALVFNSNLQSRRARAIATGLVTVPAWHYTPGMLRWFDTSDLVAAVAPRPVLVCEGGMGKDVARVRQAYRAFGADEAFRVVYSPRFADPAQRKPQTEGPPEGLTIDEFKAWAAQDSGWHYFKDDIAVPWLKGILLPKP